jgi:phosphosulfolactate phosphohydrolase-like enzyme
MQYTLKKEEIKNKNISDNSDIVIFDVCMFSTTLISLLDSGVKTVNVFGDYTDTSYPFGGEGTNKIEFKNFPQSVYGANIEKDKVGLTSDNGAKACHMVREENQNCNIIIGSTINAHKVVQYLSDKNNIILVQPGSRGTYRFEDSVACSMVSQGLNNKELEQKNLYKESLKKFIREKYEWVPETDLDRLCKFNSYNILPISTNKNEDYISFKNKSLK